MKEQITKGSGNVFADLELSNPEERAYKADLVISLEIIIKRRGVSKVEAAKLCETDIDTLSKVLRGRTSLVTADTLVRWIGLLGESVAIVSEDDFDLILSSIENPCDPNENLARAMERHRHGGTRTVCIEKTIMASAVIVSNMREYNNKKPFVLYAPSDVCGVFLCCEADMFFRKMSAYRTSRKEVFVFMDKKDSLCPVFRDKGTGTRCCVLGHAKHPSTDAIFVVFKEVGREDNVYCLDSKEFFSIMEPSWSGL